MSPEARLKNRKSKKAMYKPLPLNFLLGCSEASLASFELAKLAEMANLRSELHAVLDRLLDQMSQAAVAAWFRQSDRSAIKSAIENEETPLQMAARMIRDGQRSDEELIPLPSLSPGAAHLAAAKRYAERNIAEGKCSLCRDPLAPHSVRYCQKHLTAHRLRATPSMGREHKTRLETAKEALLKCMPVSADRAGTADALFQAAAIPSRTTGNRAIEDLLAAGAIQRLGTGVCGNPFRYFKRFQASEDRAARLRGELLKKEG